MYNKIVDCVDATAKRLPKNIAYDFMGNKVNYAKFAEQINTAARALLQLGITKSDTLCIAMPNMPQAIIMLYAANKLGVTVNMLHPLSSANEFLQDISRVKAKYILVLDQFYSKIASIRSETPLENVIVAGVAEALAPIKKLAYCLTQGRKTPTPDKGDGILLWKDFMAKGKGNTPVPISETDPKHTALILNSGGTTGKSKGVCLSNSNVMIAAEQVVSANPMLVPEDRFLSVMPIFHGNGLVVGIHSILTVGARCVLIPRFTPESYAKDLIRCRCNYISGVPSLYERLMQVEVMKNADLSFLKGVFSGADYLTAELADKINCFLKEHHAPVSVRQGYGMTEGVVATTLCPPDRQKPGSIGLPLPGVSLKIVSPGTEEELPVGEVGEILFSSGTNMLGYLNEPEETALVKRTHADGKEWICSGDLGSVDEEGFLYFKGRIKRMIVTNGYNVFPGEIENVMESFAMVERCCVVGVPYTEGTERVKAFIVLKKDIPATDQTKEEIIALCRLTIARYAVPREIAFIEKMPTTKIGKTDYQSLLKL